MAARASSRTGDFAGNDRLEADEAVNGSSPAARPGAAEPDAVARILTSLDRLGARIRTLNPAAETAAEAWPAETEAPSPRSASAQDLQRAIEQIVRKRDALERAPTLQKDRGDGRPEATRDFAEIGARVKALADGDLAAPRPTAPAVERPAAAAPEGPTLAELRSDLADLRRRIDDIRADDPARGLAEAFGEMMERLDDIHDAVDNPRVLADLARQIEEVGRRVPDLPTEAQFSAINARFDELAGHLAAAADTRSLSLVGNGLADLAEAVTRLDQRQAVADLVRRLDGVAGSLARLDERLTPFDGLGKLSEAAGRQTTLMSQIAQRTEQMPRLAHEIERQAAAVERIVQSTDALPRLLDDLDAIRRSLDAPQAPQIDEMMARIDALAGQVEESRSSALVADGTLEKQLAELIEQFDGFGDALDAKTAAVLDERFARLGAALDDRLQNFAETLPAQDQLLEALARIEAHLADATPREQIDALERRVGTLTEALGAFDFATAKDVAAIDGLIAALREEIVALSRQTNDRFDGELQGLAERIGSLAASTVEPEAIARIDRRLGEIVERLETRPDETSALAAALERLETTIEAALSPETIAARLADAVQPTPPGHLTAAALEAEIAGLRDDLRGDARRDRDLLLAIGEAVEKLARRELEAAPRAAAPRPAVRSPEVSAPITSPASAGEAATRIPPPADAGSSTWREIDAALSKLELRPEEPAPAAEDEPPARSRFFSRKATKAKTAATEPAGAIARLEPDFDANKPLEPGSGKPVPRAAAEPPSENTPAPSAGATAPEAGAVPSKADFIAAARRAAMAASIDAGQATGAGRTGKATGRGLPHFDLSLVGRHKRQIAMGAIAALVVFGSARIGYVLWQGRAAAPAEVSQSTSVAVPPAAEPAPPVVEPAPAAPHSALEAPADTATAAAGFSDKATDLSVDSFSAREPVATASLAPAVATTPATAAPAPLPPEAVGPLALRQAAAGGDRAAQFEIASRLAEGRGVKADLTEAVAWYRRAADAGLAPAQYRLGSLYEKGQGVARDTKEAAAWYTKAAAQGNAKAMHNLAVINAEGGLGEPNYQMAAKLFEQAANLGVRDSQFNLGILYARGLGVQRDLASSYKWFAIAANAGDADAARKRDDVAQVLSKEDLARARLAVETWSARPSDPAANDVVIDNPAWTAMPEHTASIDEGRLVAKAQSFLAARGFDPGPADGVMGKRTRDAVAAFQKSKGLPASGEIDQAFLKEMSDGPI